ncbi:hypothetical protein [Pleomorphovibrio marinus]|uniref:hypothetical protein n=1 Tax=Pleomorphovibrio marinus TaxID=2164132 RepID=UPI000E0B2AE0|nr:hypothetical protein [Pleomorphovibrio marinus]
MKALFETNNGDRIITHMDDAGKIHIEITSEAEVANYVFDPEETTNLIRHLRDLNNRHIDLVNSRSSFKQKLISTIFSDDEKIK